MKDDRLYLIYILECIERISSYVADGKEAFLSDAKAQDAVLHRLQALAESTQRLSDPLKDAYAEVEWRSIGKFRNVVVHDYLGIDLGEIWDIVSYDLSDLKAKVETILNQLGS